MVVITAEQYIAHYGTPRRSGRYPWGSGDDPHAFNTSLLGHIKEMRKEGMTESEIAKGLGLTTTQLRASVTMARAEIKQDQINQAQRLKDKGLSNGAIAERMGLPGESSVRALLLPGASEKADALTVTKNMLKEQVDEKGFVDVGKGNENYLGISPERLNVALEMLREDGYEIHSVNIPQAGTGFDTKTKVACRPGTTQKEAWMNRENIQPLTQYSEDQGHRYGKAHPPLGIDINRVGVRYAKDGGDEADGVIYVRRGVEDVSLGNAKYAQVRVKVGDTHFLKGMAMYKDDMPDGVDILFNTNKDNTGNKLDAMKPLKDSKAYPFGTVVRQLTKDTGTPKEKPYSVMNVVNEEGKWADWKKSISSQVVSKQSPKLAREQLDLTYEKRKKNYDEIMALTNPVVKKKLLEKFAEDSDSAAVHLKAAGLPRQNWHVILPVKSLAPTEVFAPNYKDGERVVLIRYPHGGTFEIPELTVNNRNREARKSIGADAKDAIGIHHKVAERLSGADFDGDTVIVIPNNGNRVLSTPALKQLKTFNPQREYPAYEGMPKLSPGGKQRLMGDVSNLITDMTIRLAPKEDLARAVKHSMVVIDAEKHNLNYKKSYTDNNIADLKARYQGGSRKGASTLISRAESEARVPDRTLRRPSDGGPIDPKTGKLVYVPTGATRTDKSGKQVPKTIKSTKLAETDDAFTLSSGTRMETLYATHSNKLKGLANQARLEASKAPPLKYSPQAKKAYQQEVEQLDANLRIAKMNAPRERQAQILTAAKMRSIKASEPDLDGDALKKVKFEVLEESRARVGAKKERVQITPKQWEAIQAGAVSTSKLNDILKNADMDTVVKLATPRREVLMTPTNTAAAKAMLAKGFTRSEVAEHLGVSLTTLDVGTTEGEGGGIA